jgi:hypothetical protein
MEGVEHDRRRLACRRARVRILVGSRERRDEERPAGKAEELHDRRQHADRRRDRDELEPVAREHLAEDTAGGASKTAVSMKPYQSIFNRSPPASKRLRIVPTGPRRMGAAERTEASIFR